LRPFGYAYAFVWTFGATAVLILGLQALVGLRPAAQADIVTLGAWEAVVYLLATLGVLWVHAGQKRVVPLLAVRPTHPALPVLGLALGLAIHIPAESLRRVAELVAPLTDEELATRAALLSADTTWRLVLLMLVAACLVPLVEELFFRGAVFGLLRKQHGALGAAIVSTVCFVISHPDVGEWLPLALVGAALGQLRVASGALLPCIALHVGFNALTVIAHVTGVSTSWQPMELGVPLILVGWLGTAALVYAVQHVASRPEAEQARAQDEPE
jgi:hypothetical protein